MSKRRIKLNEYTLDAILRTVMLSPSVIKHLRGGKVYAYASLSWDAVDHYYTPIVIKDVKIFSRRKVLRLIRKYKRNLRR